MRIFSVVLFVFLIKMCFAQDSVHVKSLVPGKAIKFSPLHLLNFYPTIELSYEQRVFKMTTLQLEVGYVLNYTNGNPEFLDKRGVKLKLEGRYYFFTRADRRKLYYASAEPYLNSINFDRQTSRMECFDLECTGVFRRTYNYKMEYREHGFSLKMGYLKYFSDFFFDMNSGFTLRAIKYQEPANLDDTGFEDDFVNWFEIPNETDRVTFSPSFCFRIGYRID